MYVRYWLQFHSAGVGVLTRRANFLLTGRDTGGKSLIVETRHGPGVPGVLPGRSWSPPRHLHHRQTECMSVLSGRLGYEYNGTAGVATPKSTKSRPLCFEPGVPHTWWNDANGTSLELRLVFTPAMAMLEFYRTLIGFKEDFDSHVSLLQVCHNPVLLLFSLLCRLSHSSSYSCVILLQVCP